jgi:hypothetical protein
LGKFEKNMEIEGKKLVTRINLSMCTLKKGGEPLASTPREYEDVVVVPQIISLILDSMSTSSAAAVARADSK